jgi:hypothetical protein
MGLFFEILTLVPLVFALAYSEFNFDPAIFPIEPQGHDGGSFLIRQGGKSADFFFVQQQTALAQRNVKFVAGLLIGTYVALVKPHLPAIHPGEGIAQIDFPGPDRLYLGALKLNTCLIGLRDNEVPPGFAIGCNVTHGDARSSQRPVGKMRAGGPSRKGGLRHMIFE